MEKIPSGACKTLHLVRHAQGMHNLESEKSRDPLTSFEFFDAQLSSQGWQQVRQKRKDVCANGLLKRIELVITSPMSRTLQTAVGIFHGEDQPELSDVTSYEEGNGRISDNDQQPTFNRPPIIALEVCRERLGKYECDKRGTISHYRSHFPAVDFSLIENEDDILWEANKREPFGDVLARGMKFINWLWTRKETEIAVVSHGVFLQEAFELINTNKYRALKVRAPRFENCEIRSVRISYESVMGLGSDLMQIGYYEMSIPHGNEVQRDSEKKNVSVEELEVIN
ncbi:hypothetical protein ERO13_A06G029900v2 [Gossypium hirsutum]|uniref:Phosphoglycerate mutase-like protein 1 n=1 Tax=Gossypium hirsutum TaxID=3635 RepID=A0ABM3BUT2_GOSHI|nr:phosphoglycerate mutase-like protein 1 [Gossypium hirsutum]XP_040970806.1 phosphoglycerate mutase-like protein 1 [Gossypium hirsutum]KAG4194010.1 hypothetical protein ERO13_A06G029900v2 [Gossypium hirsutum]KAG4194011.1 hypothetical protein ERO13_A06G029900v2 [Gossypium hirsutum]